MGGDKTSYILTVNAGSSSIKLGVYEANETLKRHFEAVIVSIGQATSSFVITSTSENSTKSTVAPDHSAAAITLIEWLRQQIPDDSISVIGHRIVHGGPKYYEPRIIDKEVVLNLQDLTIFDPEHLPIELKLIEKFQSIYPNIKQVACFDTAFHHDLPSVARLLPIPRRYESQGIRRYGFHGLSYSFVLQELQRLEGIDVVNGRLIFAHLGSGVSLTALYKGRSIDTTMGLTPASGVPMSSRSGDLDPGLAFYLAQSEDLNPRKFNDMVNLESGLLGISERTSDMKDLLEHEAEDIRAKEAIDLFCYQIKKNIGGLSAALGGLDVLVFTGGMGEQAPKIRSRICQGLEFIGVKIEEARNENNADVISSDDSKVRVRVIHTDESLTIAQDVQQLMAKGRRE